MNECLLALCLALGVADRAPSPARTVGTLEPVATTTLRLERPSPSPVALADTVPAPRPRTQPAQPRDRLFGEDKWTHFFASFLVTSLSASGARAAGLEREASLAVGAGVSLGLGIAKELTDRGNPRATPSLLDVAWDAAGTGAGVVVAAQAF
jgi:uncharacterized protein YfiM (DUF2279 family)